MCEFESASQPVRMCSTRLLSFFVVVVGVSVCCVAFPFVHLWRLCIVREIIHSSLSYSCSLARVLCHSLSLSTERRRKKAFLHYYRTTHRSMLLNMGHMLLVLFIIS